ncbi:MAG: polysaccharide deacetylase family protein [Candidatus Dormibacteria bacterium]
MRALPNHTRTLGAGVAALTALATLVAAAPGAGAAWGPGSAPLYVLDGYGGLHPQAGSAPLPVTAYWKGWDIARGFALFADGSGGYVLDGYGGIHAVGDAPLLFSHDRWDGWDIARGVALVPGSGPGRAGGYVLDGYGGLHAFGAAPPVRSAAYWPGHDVARGVALLPDSTFDQVSGYVLDADGGIHAFGGANGVLPGAYWPGSPRARAFTLSPAANVASPGGWVVDLHGAIHAFGSAPDLAASQTWYNRDLARGVVATAADGGYVLDAWGGLHQFGSAPALAISAYWANWDIARGAGGGGGASSGSTAARPHRPHVFLTFDDGPDPMFTPPILAELARRDQHASFFVIGRVASGLGWLVRREVADGNTVGDHTWDHPVLTSMGAAAQRDQLVRTRDLLTSFNGFAPEWWRPPYGASNPQVEAIGSSLGMHMIKWDVDPQDWRRPGSSAIYSRVLGSLHDGAVVLMHDGGGDRSQTVTAAIALIDLLSDQGWELSTL